MGNNLLARIEFLSQALCPRPSQICPHCKKIDGEVVAKKYGIVKIKRCKLCQLFYTDPIYRSVFPSFYDYFFEGVATSLPEKKYLTKLKETSFQGINKNFSWIISMLPHISSGKQLLEIGSSWGYFLYQAREAGYSARGIEIADSRRRFGAKYLDVDIRRSFNDFSKEQFDIIFSYHVLEHFTDISRIFSEIHRSLKPRGVLALEVPNFDFTQFGGSILSIIGAVHPLGYCTDFFTTTLPDYGFRNIRVFNNWSEIPDHPVKRCSNSGLIILADK